MSEEQYTRCPQCHTVYRVTEAQLAQRNGRVRCGQCQAVFDGKAELVALALPADTPAAPPAGRAAAEGAAPAAEPPPAAGPPGTEAHAPMAAPDASPPAIPSPGPVAGPSPLPSGAEERAPDGDEGTPPGVGEGAPDVAAVPSDEAGGEFADEAGKAATDEYADAAGKAAADEDADEGAMAPAAATEPPAGVVAAPAPAPAEPGAGRGTDGEPVPAGEEAQAAAAPDATPAAAAPPSPRASAPADRGARVFFGVSVALLGVLLPLQAAFHFRETISARWPPARPLIQKACAVLGCTVGAPREVADLEIQASDLQADPAHQGLLILTATVRNRGAVALAYPLLELTLTDAQDQIVVRRTLTPAEYVGGTVDLARGIPANSDLAIKLFIDASATSQAGYRLYLYYG